MRLHHVVMPHPAVGVGRLAPSSHKKPGTGLNPSLTMVSGGLTLTKDDFRTHRAPMPLMHMTVLMTHPFAVPTDKPSLSNSIDGQHEISRSNCVRRTRSPMTIFTSNTPLRPNYRAAACRAYATSAAQVPRSKVSFRSSPLPCSARLGSTISPGRPASPRLTLTPNPRVGPLVTRSVPCPTFYCSGYRHHRPS